jgi:hypothetical protein
VSPTFSHRRTWSRSKHSPIRSPGLHHPSVAVPRRHEQAAIDAVERCPGECIYLEPDESPYALGASDADIVDAVIVDD